MKKYSVRPIKGTTLLDHLLFYRGIESVEAAETFLNPDYDNHSHDPFAMKDMDKAVDRILKALRDNEKTVIYSDYDTDGIPASVALYDFFKKVGYENFSNYIPHRHDEGFGLNLEAVEQFGKDGVKLLVTIDCGMGDAVAVSRAKELGIDVIIVDHHLSNGELPAAFAILNPKQAGCAYPEKMLCAAGVVFKLIQALCARLRSELEIENCPPAWTSSTRSRVGKLKIPAATFPIGWEKWLLDMVGIATLSDMVPLVGENRLFAYYGLKVLRKSPRVGLMKLFSKLNVAQGQISEEDIGFTVGPRINAASRMGVPMDAFRLLATRDETEADGLADHLNKINNERKGTVAALMKEIKKIARERYLPVHSAQTGEPAEKRVMVIGNPSWRPALLGLAANSCANEYQCPVFLWGRDGDNVIKGSCRSGTNVNLVDFMSRTAPGTFIQFGGHAFSGGFSVSNDKIHSLEEELRRVYESVRVERETGSAEENFVDQELSLEDVNWEIYRMIEKLAPFGTGNPKPVFLFSGVRPEKVRHFGKEKNHLELVFEKPDGGHLNAIAFFKSADGWGREIAPGKPLNLVATFEKSAYRNFSELRLRIVDIV